jgi:hypothetical protein
MKTVRELIQALLLNSDLDDDVSVEVKVQDKHTGESCFQTHLPKRVFHMADGEAVIECHDD